MPLHGPWRRTSVSGPYLGLDLPELFRVDFLTEQGSWMEWGAFRGEQAEREPDGSYVLLSAGSPFFIRCVADFGEYILHVDQGGKGEPFVYRIVGLD